MGTLDGRYDALHASQLIACPYGLVVVDTQHLRASLAGHVAVHGSHTGIVQSGRDGEGLFNLSVLVLHHQHLGTVQDARSALVDGGCRMVGLPSVASGFGQDYLHALVVHVVVNRSGSIRTTSDAGHQIVGIVTPHLFLQLPFYLLRDYALHPGHKVGIGMWPHRRAHDIERLRRVAAPVADGLRAGVRERHVARADGMHLGTQHLHAFHVGVLALHIGGTHEDLALHIHQCANRGRSHSVLSGSSLGDDAGLPHSLCQ